MKFIIWLLFAVIFLTLSQARAGEFEDQIRKLYADQTEMMSRKEIDIPEMLGFTDKYYAEDIKMTTSLLNTNTGKTDISTMTKAQMLDQIPGQYARTVNNRTEMNISQLSLKDGPWHAVVKYEMKYEAGLKLMDKMGRHYERPMHLYSLCVEELQRSARGWPQITESDCKGAVKYGDVKYKSWHD